MMTIEKENPTILEVRSKSAQNQSRSNLSSNMQTKLLVRSMSEIKEKSIDWLWENWIPLGKITILAGVGGAGKTNLMMSIAATVSRATQFPDGTFCKNGGSVLIYSTEDAADDTIKPRIMTYVADFKKILVIDGSVDDKGKRREFSIDDIPLLENLVNTINDLRLIIIDPIVSIIRGDVNKANDVRETLDVLSKFAEKYNCAVVGITHFSKAKKGVPISERVLGSQAFTAKARMVLTAIQSGVDDTCYLSRIKMNNIKNDHLNMRYRIDTVKVSDNIETSKTIWLDPVVGNIENILKELESADHRSHKMTEKDKAKQFLFEILNGEKEIYCKHVEEMAKKQQLNYRAVQRASEEIKVIKFKGKDNYWYWRLPVDVD